MNIHELANTLPIHCKGLQMLKFKLSVIETNNFESERTFA